jgi:hypothetical protein
MNLPAAELRGIKRDKTFFSYGRGHGVSPSKTSPSSFFTPQLTNGVGPRELIEMKRIVAGFAP